MKVYEITYAYKEIDHMAMALSPPSTEGRPPWCRYGNRARHVVAPSGIEAIELIKADVGGTFVDIVALTVVSGRPVLMAAQ